MSDTTSMIRVAQDYLRAIAARREARDVDPSSAGASLLCITTTAGSYPTSAARVFLLSPCELDAADTEGATATPTPDATQNIYAVNLGSQVPPQGTLVVVHAVGGVWAFRYDG